VSFEENEICILFVDTNLENQFGPSNVNALSKGISIEFKMEIMVQKYCILILNYQINKWRTDILTNFLNIMCSAQIAS
jgi:hypothetical protein